LVFAPQTAASAREDSQPRVPSLDGCRAISILLVVLAHLCRTPAFRVFDPYARWLYHCGPYGVEIFFVISGFLITKLLLQEELSHGRISILRFYIRRAFKIWPVAYAYLLVIALLAWTHVIAIAPHHLLYAATFLTNQVEEANWFTGHFWSLAIEEQFYILWPVVFLHTSRRRRLLCCCLIVLLAPLLRTLAYVYAPSIHREMQFSLLFMGDAIAIGCIMALLSQELEKSRIVHRIISLHCFFLIPALSVFMYATLKLLPAFYFALGRSIALLCIATTLWKVMHAHDSAVRVLNAWLMVKIGVLSYSLYVWQQVFLNPTSTSTFNHLPLNLLLVCAAAVASHYLLELPFLRLRPRFSAWLEARRRGLHVRPSASAISTSV
jgi:peptidoglycan/LPS O-acetylase OafA/YrhL